MNDFFDLISQRESCRKYDPAKPVEREKLVRCLEAARCAPSACNGQPWSYTAVCDKTLLPKVSKCVQEKGMNLFSDTAPCLIIVVEEETSPVAVRGGQFKNQNYPLIDIGLSVSQLCLAATAQGLSTCIIGWFDEPRLKELLDIQKDKRVRLVITLGYAVDDAIRAKKRKSLEDIARIL